MIVLYHANCNDGSAAALAAWLKLGDNGHQYIAVSHGQPPPKAVVGEDVIMVDFCYPRNILLSMGAKSIVILDHHISAKKDLSTPFPNNSQITAHFDLSQSGAVISWHYFFPNQPLPRLFELVQDRDIWTNQYPESVFLSYGLNIYGDQFRQWQNLIDHPEKLNEIIEDGKAIYSYIQREAEKLIATRITADIGGYQVPVINAPNFVASDALHRILQLEPNAPFAASYSDRQAQGVRAYSLRSENHREDVSVIAAKLGGGGHRNAAAFHIKLKP